MAVCGSGARVPTHSANIMLERQTGAAVVCDLGIARPVLADRLKHLVDAGVLERRRYCERPPRDEYRLKTG